MIRTPVRLLSLPRFFTLRLRVRLICRRRGFRMTAQNDKLHEELSLIILHIIFAIMFSVRMNIKH